VKVSGEIHRRLLWIFFSRRDYYGLFDGERYFPDEPGSPEEDKRGGGPLVSGGFRGFFRFFQSSNQHREKILIAIRDHRAAAPFFFKVCHRPSLVRHHAPIWSASQWLPPSDPVTALQPILTVFGFTFFSILGGGP
jgi:hypothetical protein